MFPIDTNAERPRPRLGRALEHRQAERARLRREPDRSRAEAPRREGRVQPDGGDRDPEAVRADEPRAVGADEREQPLLALDALRARLGEARRDDAERAVPVRSAASAASIDMLAGDADDREVDWVGDLLERGVGADAGDRLARPVHRVGGARELRRLRMLRKSSPPIDPRRARGADTATRRRREERPQRCGDRDVVALVDARLVAPCRGDRELTSTTPLVELARRLEPGVREHGQHGPVLGEHLRDERLDPVLGGAGAELLEQPRADPLPLEFVGDRERDLGRVRVAQPRRSSPARRSAPRRRRPARR